MQSRRFERYYDAIRYLEGLSNISSLYQKTNLAAHPRPEIFLERMQEFLDLLGNPEKGFKYIHITGTAGKGSVSAMVHAALTASGKKSGLFTSPFTVSTIEKIQTGDLYIDPQIFADITESLKPVVDKALIQGKYGAPSYFELIFAIALIYFRRQKCEFVVLEVGLGGRFDATNIIKEPLVTAITNIGLDHTAVLGPTRALIAHDKAGIIKKGSAFFTTEATPSLVNLFKKECAGQEAFFNALSVNGFGYNEKNHRLAEAICNFLGILKPDFCRTQLPARFEIVGQDPLIIIDGAHNVSKIRSTTSNIKELSYRKLAVVVAISSDKDWQKIIKELSQHADYIYVTRFSIPGRSCVNPRSLYLVAKKHAPKKVRISAHSDPVQAFRAAKEQLKDGDLLVVTGSFYLAGDIRSLYCPEEQVLRNRSSAIVSK